VTSSRWGSSRRPSWRWGNPIGAGGRGAQWVRSRQYTGRVVSVTNDKVFVEAVYNYTRDFPYQWEELTLPITYRGDRHLARADFAAGSSSAHGGGG